MHITNLLPATIFLRLLWRSTFLRSPYPNKSCTQSHTTNYTKMGLLKGRRSETGNNLFYESTFYYLLHFRVNTKIIVWNNFGYISIKTNQLTSLIGNPSPTLKNIGSSTRSMYHPKLFNVCVMIKAQNG